MEKATRQHTKEHNKNLILNTIYNQAEVSRADIARLTGLTRTTVSDIVAELMEDGLVAEVGQGQSAGGNRVVRSARGHHEPGHAAAVWQDCRL